MLLAYGHQIWVAGASDVNATIDRFISDSSQGHRGHDMKMKRAVNRGDTNSNRCTQRLVILQTY